MKETTLARAFGVDRVPGLLPGVEETLVPTIPADRKAVVVRAKVKDEEPAAPDPISGLALQEVYRAGRRTLTREMIRDVATAVRDAPKGGIRASEIADLVRPDWPSPVDVCDRRIDRALQILRGRGVIRQGKYPRWVWARGGKGA